MQNKGIDFHNKDSIWVYPNPHDPKARNPYLKLLYQNENTIKTKSLPKVGPIMWFGAQKSVVHHHWFEFRSLFGFIRLIFRLVNLWCFSKLGGQIYWTFHNLRPHNAPFIKIQLRLRKILWGLSDTIFVHHPSHIEWIQKELNWSHSNIQFYHHPNYEIQVSGFKTPSFFGISQLDQKPFLLIYGQVAPYKNILSLLKSLNHVRVIVAGISKEVQYGQVLRKWVESQKEHYWIEKFISMDEEAWLHTNALAVLFGFEEILYSGGVHLANQYQSPLILPKLKPLAFYKANFYEDANELKKIIQINFPEVIYD